MPTLVVVSGPPGGFGKTTLATPVLHVDTTDGYRPALPEIVAFAGARHHVPG
ncbi:hypothetical protein ABN034_28845 [Actinopolymorpha sp. B11F2]|uniref:hypothetical protein n=1 Tax=Actinopolymorpha sp. B11F2 TaxID=3160862 RepID=UPI0032E52D2E